MTYQPYSLFSFQHVDKTPSSHSSNDERRWKILNTDKNHLQHHAYVAHSTFQNLCVYVRRTSMREDPVAYSFDDRRTLPRPKTHIVTILARRVVLIKISYINSWRRKLVDCSTIKVEANEMSIDEAGARYAVNKWWNFKRRVQPRNNIKGEEHKLWIPC